MSAESDNKKKFQNEKNKQGKAECAKHKYTNMLLRTCDEHNTNNTFHQKQRCYMFDS